MRNSGIEARTDVETFHLLLECSHKSVVDAFLYVKSIGANACLSGTSKLASEDSVNSDFKVGIIEDDVRSVATQLHRNLLHRLHRLPSDELAN